MNDLYGLPDLDELDYMGDTVSPLQAKAGDDESVASSFRFDKDTLLASLKRIYGGQLDVSSEVEEGLWQEVYRILSEASDTGLAESGSAVSTGFRRQVAYHTAAFSAFKVHRMQNDIAARLHDSNGILKPFKQWLNDVQSMLDHHTGSWLRTEYDTAVIRMHQAADWQRFEEDADILPNLEWMPSTSAHPGADHRLFWGTVLPVNDSFWNRHRPGDRWNCKCWLKNTDAPATKVPDGGDSPKDRPSPGLDNNPGVDGKLFGDSHPYMANAYPGAEKAVRKFMAEKVKEGTVIKVEAEATALEKVKIKARTKELRKEAAVLKEESFVNKDFHKEMHITGRGIKEWLNQPHEHYAQKNELLLDINNVMKKAKYLGYGNDKHDPSVKAHLFEIEIVGDKSWIIVRELNPSRCEIYSISDSSNILRIIKEPTS